MISLSEIDESTAFKNTLFTWLIGNNLITYLVGASEALSTILEKVACA